MLQLNDFVHGVLDEHEVAAAGNDGTNQQFYPAAYTSVVAVSSTTTNDAKSSFSQYGTWVDIAAPGSAIYSTYATSLYSRIQGTSMASPNVAGLLGLMKSYAPNVSNQNLINCLYSSATNIDAVNSGFIGQLGAGRINAYQALLCLQQYNVSVDAGITAVSSPGATVCSGSFTPTVTLALAAPIDTLLVPLMMAFDTPWTPWMPCVPCGPWVP